MLAVIEYCTDVMLCGVFVPNHIDPTKPDTKRLSNSLNKDVPNWLQMDGTTVFLWSILSMSTNPWSPPLWAASSSTRPCAKR